MIRKFGISLFLGCFVCGHVYAGPADYVYTPTVEYGEREIDFKFGTAEDQESTRENVTSVGYGYGATEYWFTEIYLKRETADGNGESDGLNIAEWENKFQLTETGKYPIEIGLITEVEAPLEHNKPYELKLGPLLQTDFDKLQLNANLLFERLYGHEEPDEDHTTEMGYQWQVKYRWQQAFECGLQGFGDMGEWNHWEDSDEQDHKLGPAIFGKIGLGNRQAIRYNTAVLFGVSDSAPDYTFRMQAEYEF
jgi:hypothetical protein